MSERFDADPDPLAALRAAWRTLDAPAPADPLADADPLTRRTVEWMRAAWETVESERAPLLPPGVRKPRAPFRSAVLLRLAAAVLAVALGALLWWRPEGTVDVGRGEPGAVADRGALPTIEPRAPQAERVPERPVPERAVQFASLSSEKIEMRSGPVRLVLVTGGGRTADGGARNPIAEEEP